MIYTDDVHLVADSLKDLHEFASKIGLKRCWFHNPRGKNHPHYDLVHKGARYDAIEAGAKKVTTKQIINVLKK